MGRRVLINKKMPKETETLFFDYGGLIVNYDFNPQTTLQRAHKLMQCHLNLNGRWAGIRSIDIAHNKAILAYLEARKDGSEWHMDRIMGLMLSNLGNFDGLDVREVSRIYALNDHDVFLKGNVPKALDELSKRGSLNIISNLPHDAILHELGRFGIRGRFDTVTVSYEVGFRKPRPEIYLEALRRSGADPSRSTFVSHELVETQGAEAVGIRGVLANSLEEAVGAIGALK